MDVVVRSAAGLMRHSNRWHLASVLPPFCLMPSKPLSMHPRGTAAYTRDSKQQPGFCPYRIDELENTVARSRSKVFIPRTPHRLQLAM